MNINTISNKLYLSFLVLILLFGIFGWFSSNKLDTINDEVTIIIEEEITAMQRAMELKSLVLNNQTVLLEHMLNEEDSIMTDKEMEFHENHREIEALVSDISKFIHNEAELMIFESIQEDMEFVLRVQLAAIEASKVNYEERAMALLEPISKSSDKLDESLNQLIILYAEDAGEAAQGAYQMISQSKLEIYIFMAILILLGSFGSFIIGRIISQPIRKVSEAMKEVASGNLAIDKMDVKTNDEIKDLIESVNKMVEDIHHTIYIVTDAATQIASSSQELTANTEQNTTAAEQVATLSQKSADGTDVQLQSIHQVADSIDSLSEAIQKIIDNTEFVDKLVAASTELSNEGSESVSMIVNQMNDINTTVKEAAEIIKNLGQRSSEIGSVVEIITDISDQTNLLSLNAAIEAARAGEQGHGFAVVANEVRKLAEQSKKSAAQIAVMVNDIQQETNLAVESMDKIINKVKNSLSYSQDTSKAFSEIEQSIKNVSHQVKEATLTVEQVEKISFEIMKEIDNVKTVAHSEVESSQAVSAATEEQLASMEEITSSAQSLSKLAEELQLLVSNFKL